MYTLFLTGGIGSGKSTVSGMLRDRGAHVIDLDAVAHEALRDASVREALAARFGEDVLDADGQVVRPELARRAFQDEEATAALDAITHPAILRRLADLLAEQRRTGVALCVVEVQVAEAADPSMADEVMTLTCDRQTRRARAVARGMGGADFDARDAAQVGDNLRVALADTVVDATVPTEALAAAVGAWYDARAAGGWSGLPRSTGDAGRATKPIEQPAGLPSPAISFIGRHNSGKTTLIVAVIRELVRRGVDVGSVKHHSHRGFDIDVRGKDSWRHRHAGASEVAIAAPDQFALVRSIDGEMAVEDVVRMLRPHQVVVVEGYRTSAVPAIEVMRAANERDRLAGEAFAHAVSLGQRPPFDPEPLRDVLGRDAERLPDERTVAVVSDMPRVRRAALACGMRAFELDDVAGVCDLVCREVARPGAPSGEAGAPR